MEYAPEFHREGGNEREAVEKLSESLETLSYYNDLVRKLKRTETPSENWMEMLEEEWNTHEKTFSETGESEESEGEEEEDEIFFELTRKEDVLEGREDMEREMSEYGFSLLSRPHEEQETYPELFLEVHDEESVKEALRTLLRTIARRGESSEHAHYVLGDLITALRETLLEESIPPEEKFPIFFLISKELPKLAQEYGVESETIPQFSSFQEAANAVNRKYEETYRELLHAGIETEGAVRENVEDRYHNLRRAGFELRGDEFLHYLADMNAFLKAYTQAMEKSFGSESSPEQIQYLIRIGKEFHRALENVAQSIREEESRQITQASFEEYRVPYKTALTYLRGFQERLEKMLFQLETLRKN